MICPICGKTPVQTIEQYHYLESGLENVHVSGVRIFSCDCGEKYVQLPGVDSIHNQIASALLRKNSRLTGTEAKFLRKWLGLTSEELATALGTTRVSVSRWENKGFTAANDRALRLYASQVGKISIDVRSLFPTIKDKPEMNFRIEVEGMSQRSVNASGAVTAVPSVQGFVDMLTDFDKTLTMSATSSEVVKPSENPANQELALAA